MQVRSLRPAAAFVDKRGAAQPPLSPEKKEEALQFAASRLLAEYQDVGNTEEEVRELLAAHGTRCTHVYCNPNGATERVFKIMVMSANGEQVESKRLRGYMKLAEALGLQRKPLKHNASKK
jgi:hypothetical protein